MEVIQLRERYIPPFIMLLAGAIASIYNIVNKTEVLTALKTLLIVLIIFYIIGLIVKAIYLHAVVKAAKKNKDGQDESKTEGSPEGGESTQAGTGKDQKQDGIQAGKA